MPQSPPVTIFSLVVSALSENILTVLIGIFVIGVLAAFFGGRWMLKVDKGIEQVEDASSWLKKIYDLLNIVHNYPVKAQGSPISLTDLGWQIIKTLKPDTLIDTYAKQLLPEAQAMNAYQIQTLAFTFAETKMLSDLTKSQSPWVMDIEKCAFAHGVEVQRVMEALSVVLREKIFALKGISVDDL